MTSPSHDGLVERLRARAITHERGFPSRLLYTRGDQRLDLDAATALETLSSELARERERREAAEALLKEAGPIIETFLNCYDGKADGTDLHGEPEESSRARENAVAAQQWLDAKLKESGNV